METLTKETLTLHRVLSRHLSEGEVSMIARRIFVEYKAQWTKAFGEVEVKTERGERALLKDAEAFDAKLSKIEEFGSVGKEVVGVVRAKIKFVDQAKTQTQTATEKKEESTPVEKVEGKNGEVGVEKLNGEETKG
jgi:vacuolar protein sorting-associated protein 54